MLVGKGVRVRVELGVAVTLGLFVSDGLSVISWLGLNSVYLF